MKTSRIGELLQPFVGEVELPPAVLEQVQLYLQLLLRWNARVNLTAVRDPEQIVTRHFGESLFAARVLLENCNYEKRSLALADVGSGAGFPGVPIKLLAPKLELTLIESQNKKATFLREVVRTLKLESAEVFSDRAEHWGKTADVVTLRAVEQFERVLPVAANLVGPGGRLVLLIGVAQFEAAQRITGDAWTWREPIAIPQSTGRVIAIGEYRPGVREALSE